MKNFLHKTFLPLFFVGLTIFSYYKLGGSNSETVSESRQILDTVVTIKIDRKFRNKLAGAFSVLQKVENEGEWHKKSSHLNKALAPGSKKSATLEEILDLSLKFAAITNGAFDPTIRPLVELWSIGDKNLLPKRDEIVKAKLQTGYSRPENKNMVNLSRVDLGGILKGYAVDKAARALRASGINNFLISTVSSTLTSGNKSDGRPWMIGIENPRKSESNKSMIAILKLNGSFSVSTSGDYQRYFVKDKKRYAHILDPKTGYPADRCMSVTLVTTGSAASADALSTAVFVMGYPEGLKFVSKLKETEALVVDTKGRIHLSNGMAAYLDKCDKSVY